MMPAGDSTTDPVETDTPSSVDVSLIEPTSNAIEPQFDLATDRRFAASEQAFKVVRYATGEIGAPTMGLGSTHLIGVGTPGANLLLKTLSLLDQAGLHDYAGGISLVEFDTQVSHNFSKRLPQVFAQNAHTTYHTALSNGFARHSPAEVGSPDIAGLWKPVLDTAIQNLASIRGSNLNVATLQSTIIIFGSLGGHAALTVATASQSRASFPHALIVVRVTIPVDARMRSWAREVILQLMESEVDVIILSDDRIDPVRDDRNAVVAIASAVCGLSFTGNEILARSAVLAGLCPPQGRRRGLLAIQISSADDIPASPTRGNDGSYLYDGSYVEVQVPRQQELLGRLLEKMSGVRKHYVNADELANVLARHIRDEHTPFQNSSVGGLPSQGWLPKTTQFRSIAGSLNLMDWQVVSRAYDKFQRTQRKSQLDNLNVEPVYFPMCQRAPEDRHATALQCLVTTFATVADSDELLAFIDW